MIFLFIMNDCMMAKTGFHKRRNTLFARARNIETTPAWKRFSPPQAEKQARKSGVISAE
jgi:hypothetical protein